MLSSQIKAVETWWTVSDISAAGKSVIHAKELAQIPALFYSGLQYRWKKGQIKSIKLLSAEAMWKHAVSNIVLFKQKPNKQIPNPWDIIGLHMQEAGLA